MARQSSISPRAASSNGARCCAAIASSCCSANQRQSAMSTTLLRSWPTCSATYASTALSSAGSTVTLIFARVRPVAVATTAASVVLPTVLSIVVPPSTVDATGHQQDEDERRDGRVDRQAGREPMRIGDGADEGGEGDREMADRRDDRLTRAGEAGPEREVRRLLERVEDRPGQTEDAERERLGGHVRRDEQRRDRQHKDERQRCQHPAPGRPPRDDRDHRVADDAGDHRRADRERGDRLVLAALAPQERGREAEERLVEQPVEAVYD